LIKRRRRQSVWYESHSPGGFVQVGLFAPSAWLSPFSFTLLPSRGNDRPSRPSSQNVFCRPLPWNENHRLL